MNMSFGMSLNSLTGRLSKARRGVFIVVVASMGILPACAPSQIGIEKVKANENITGVGTTHTLEILPLIDWHTSRTNLKREAGLSYLIQTDDTQILFDVGWNRKKEDPSPLLHNMQQLKVSLSDIDAIVISHNHSDHVGGSQWQRRKTFSLTNQQIRLGNIKVYAPIPMSYPGLRVIHSKEPIVISSGVATIGVLQGYMFFTGEIQEQTLAVRVEGKGIVLIVGCGHPTLQKIVDRTKALFNEPIYGVIGGLHYPVPNAPIKVLGMLPLRYFATEKPPWKPLTMEEVQGNIDLLLQEDVQAVGLSGHDSSEEVIERFRGVFGVRYREVTVGKEIVF